MCEMNSFEMLHECCKQPEIRQYQIWAVRRVWNNLKSDILFHHCSGSTCVGSSIVMLKKHWLPPPPSSLWQTQLICCFNLFESSHILWSQFSLLNWPTFCLFRSCVEVTGLLDHDWLIRSKFPPLSLNFFTQWCTVLMSTISSPQKSIMTGEFQWEFHFYVSKTENLHAVWGKFYTHIGSQVKAVVTQLSCLPCHSTMYVF